MWETSFAWDKAQEKATLTKTKRDDVNDVSNQTLRTYACWPTGYYLAKNTWKEEFK
jgi:hypothetical protein